MSEFLLGLFKTGEGEGESGGNAFRFKLFHQFVFLTVYFLACLHALNSPSPL